MRRTVDGLNGLVRVVQDGAHRRRPVDPGNDHLGGHAAEGIGDAVPLVEVASQRELIAEEAQGLDVRPHHSPRRAHAEQSTELAQGAGRSDADLAGQGSRGGTLEQPAGVDVVAGAHQVVDVAVDPGGLGAVEEPEPRVDRSVVAWTTRCPTSAR